MAKALSVDQFIALETWVEACAALAALSPLSFGPDWNAKKAKLHTDRHRARQRAFTLLTGIEAPLIDAQPESEDNDLA